MSLRHLIYHNFWLKLFSLVLASLIYLVIREPDVGRDLMPALTTPDTREYRVPVTVVKRPADARVFKVSPEQVLVTVTGEAAVLRELSTRDLLAQVDMTDPRQTPDLTHVVRTYVPSGVVVTDVSPRAVTVERISP